jgi:hypothetical protein
MRRLMTFTALLLFGILLFCAVPSFAPLLAATADSILQSLKLSPLAEPNFDRPGQDYKSFDMDSENANICESACRSDQRCKAWTFVKPGAQAPKARCWLKAGVPPLKSNSCCVSGLKAGICDSGSYWDASAQECRARVH